MEIKVKANAKVNLYLKITGTDEKGYHLLKMINSSLDIFDVVSVCVADGDGINVEFENAPYLDRVNNTAYKAAEKFKKEFSAFCVGKKINVKIKKGIPEGAGLGGSSADAAAVLYSLQKTFDADKEKISNIATAVGSDVAYMIDGGMALVQGTGEKIEKLPFKDFSLLVAKPLGGVSTALCYGNFDKQTQEEKRVDLSFDDGAFFNEFGFKPFNSLTNPAVKLNENVAYLLDLFKKEGANACFMTGSGSAVCAYFLSSDKAQNTLSVLKKDPIVEFARIARSVKFGTEITEKNV